MTATAPALAIALALALGTAAVLVLKARHLRAEVERHRTALARSVERLGHIEQSFQRFAPLDVVEQFAQGSSAAAPTHRNVTIMFADLKGFTPLSERIPPAEMVEMLNGYFRAMNGALVAHHGHLSRLMGDGLMALFGALENNPWQTADAVKAALAMREALAAYNEEIAKRGLGKLEFGVGIHTGDVVAGVMGSDRFMEFTVIGDPVNLAARVEALTRVHNVDILVTEAVQKTLDARFVTRAMPPMAVKGKTEPVATFAIESFDPKRGRPKTGEAPAGVSG
jgi:adenylate cyclase